MDLGGLKGNCTNVVVYFNPFVVLRVSLLFDYITHAVSTTGAELIGSPGRDIDCCSPALPANVVENGLHACIAAG